MFHLNFIFGGIPIEEAVVESQICLFFLESFHRYVGKSTVHRSGLTPLRAQISSDRLVYCRIYPLASLYLWLSAPIIYLDSTNIYNQLSSVPVGTPAVPDMWVSVAISPVSLVGMSELPCMWVLVIVGSCKSNWVFHNFSNMSVGINLNYCQI